MKILFTIALLLIAATAGAHTATWTDNSDNEDGFILESCAGLCTQQNPGWTEIARTGANVTSLTFSGVPNTSYRMKAFNLAGVSGPSNIVTLPSAPGDPTLFLIGP